MESIIISNLAPASSSLDVTTLLATPSKSVKVEGRKTGAVIKVPTVIGKTIVQVYIEASADLEEPALEINNISHAINLTGCEFMQIEDAKNGKLILNGYIKENIDYKTIKVGMEDGALNIGSRRTAMSIPFKCFTKIQLDSEPEISPSNSLINSEENRTQSAINGNNSYYLNSNEELSFEVAETKIHQVNVKKNTANVTINNFGEEVFSSLSINMAVDVVLVILQNQFVEIPSSGKSDSNGKSSGNSGNGSSNNGGNSGDKSKSKKDSDNKKSSSKSTKYNWLKSFEPYVKMTR